MTLPSILSPFFWFVIGMGLSPFIEILIKLFVLFLPAERQPNFGRLFLAFIVLPSAL